MTDILFCGGMLEDLLLIQLFHYKLWCYKNPFLWVTSYPRKLHPSRVVANVMKIVCIVVHRYVKDQRVMDVLSVLLGVDLKEAAAAQGDHVMSCNLVI